MKQHKGWPEAGASGTPSMGPGILKLYLSLDRKVSSMPLCVGWHRAIRVFGQDYLRKTRETTWSRFDARGALAPI
jgi:hypothetical protein